jgi:hypothetical protein
MIRTMTTLLSALVLFASPIARAEDQSAEPADAAAEDPVDPEAAGVLQALTDRLAKAAAVRVDIETNWEVIQRNGIRLEFGNVGTIEAKRPDRFRGRATSWEGSETGVVFDGKTVTVFDKEEKVYGQLEKLGTIDEMLDYLDGEYEHSVQLGHLFRNDASERMRKGLAEAEFAQIVGDATLDGRLCRHIVVRNDETTTQFWITHGEPELVRLAIAYEIFAGEPQFRAQFGEWDLSPRLKDGDFAFEPPKGAEKIRFDVPTFEPATSEDTAK